MAQMTRLLRYGMRFLSDRRYRNHVLSVLDRHVQGAKHPAVANADDPQQAPQFLQGKRLFIAAGCDQTFMAEYLAQLGLQVCHSHAIGRGTDPLTELLMPDSPALCESWDYYLLSVAQILRGPVRRIQTDGINYSREQQDEDLDAIIHQYRRSISLIREASQTPIFLFSYLLTYLPTYGLHEYRSLRQNWSLIEFWHLYQLKLYALAREFQEVFVLDAELAVEQTGKSVVVDATQSNGIFDHPTRAGAKILGDHFVRSLQILESGRAQVKCAVFDLDNTLWSGVLREDGPGGVAVNEYYLNVMEKMAARGILLAICSKNDAAEREHLPGLLGADLHGKIVSRHLSWKPKSQVLQEIAEELNIGLDTLAFFDDSPFERAEVKTNAPQVMVYEPEDLFACLNRPEFHPTGEITPESLSRSTKYRQQAQRKQAERSSGKELKDFLLNCNFQLELRSPRAGEISRIHELLQRTNQLHATLTRPSLGELNAQFRDTENYLMRVVRLSDQFGDYGLIGFAAIEKRGSAWEIMDLAFSCRAMGRGAELATLNHLAKTASEHEVREMGIQFRTGPRNQQMLEILLQAEFLPEGEMTVPEGSSVRMTRSLGLRHEYPIPEWLNLVGSEELESIALG